MMTIQVLELPNGSFVIVISGEDAVSVAEDLGGLKEATGACSILISTTPVEVRR